MLPSTGLMRIVLLVVYAITILSALVGMGTWIGSKLAYASDIKAINQTLADVTEAVHCSAYQNRRGQLETREILLTHEKSQLEASRQAGIKLTSIELQRYNDVVLALAQLADERRALKGAEACK